MKSDRYLRLCYAFLFYLLLTTLPAFSQTTLEEIISDMKLSHEGRPHGVPTSYNWALKPRPGAVEPPADWTAAIAWGQVYEWINGNPATNTRVQLKDLELYYLSKKDYKWHRLQKTLRVNGAAYVEDFVADVNKPADIRVESDGSISVTAGGGYNFHFWPSSGRVSIPANQVAGCFVTLKARLILGNPLANDDRDSAKYVLSVGGDWWLSLSAAWDNFKTNADMGIGRFRFVTPEWRSYSMYSVPADTLRNNPPPFVQLVNGIEEVLTGSKENQLQLKLTPNPARAFSSIQYSLPHPGLTRICIYDMEGRQVQSLLNQQQPAGPHILSWNCSSLARGSYFVHVECEGLLSSGLSLLVD